MNTQTQRSKILNYCKTHGSITVRDAFEKLYINSPTKRISEIRRSDGFIVDSITETRKNAAGLDVTYKRYFITEAVKQ